MHNPFRLGQALGVRVVASSISLFLKKFVRKQLLKTFEIWNSSSIVET